MKINIGLLLMRLVIGMTFIGHGAQKLFGWFGGYGLKGTGDFFASIGLQPGITMAAVAGTIELIGGILLVIGLLAPVAGLMLASTMIMAILKVHASVGWLVPNGFEYPLILLAASIGVGLTGSGKYSIDSLVLRRLNR